MTYNWQANVVILTAAQHQYERSDNESHRR